MRWVLACVLAVLLGGAWEALARADGDNPHLVRAREEIDELQYDKANRSLEQALSVGGNSPDELVELFRLWGEVSAAMGDPDGAEEHFKQLLVLKPDARLRTGVSPKISEPFETAKAFFSEHQGLKVRYELRTEPEPTLVVTVKSDPLGMVARARVELLDGEGSPVELDGTERFLVPLASAEKQRLILSILDEHGNRLVELGSKDEPLVVAPPAAAVPTTTEPLVRDTTSSEKDEEEPSRSVFGRWWFYGSLAVATGVGGGVCAWQSQEAEKELATLNADSENHDFSEAQRVQQRGERFALGANVGFAAAGTFALVSVVLLVRDLVSDEPASTETSRMTVAPMPTHGGAGIAFDLSF